MKKTRGLFSQIFFLAFVLEIFFCCEVFAQAAGQASLIEGAKKEGRVVWYATLNINDSNMLLHRFEQKYPFIKTELLRAGSEQLLNRSSGRLDVEPLVPEMHPGKLKIAAIDPTVGEELSKYSKEFREIYFR